MKLINDLNSKKIKENDLIDETVRFYMDFVKQNPNCDKDNFKKLVKDNIRLKYMDFEEYKRLAELKEEIAILQQKPERSKFSGKIKENSKLHEKKEEFIKLSKTFLIRNIANDMCSNDCKSVFDHNYKLLYSLGYLGKADIFIPEIVRGNFLLFLKREFLVNQTKKHCEDIDRMNLLLKDSLGIIINSDGEEIKTFDSNGNANKGIHRNKESRIINSGSVNAEYVHYYLIERPISTIRSELGKRFMCKQLSDEDIDTLLYDLDLKIFKDIRNSGIKLNAPTRDEMIEDLINEKSDVTTSTDETLDKVEENYRKLATAAYDGKSDNHPIIRNGFENYKYVKVFENVENKMAKYLNFLRKEVKSRLPKTKEYLEYKKPVNRSLQAILDYKEFYHSLDELFFPNTNQQQGYDK